MAAEAPRTGGNDIITGGLGDDLIFAQEGNDLIKYTIGDGFDHVDGGINPAASDVDTFDVTGSAAGEIFHVESLAAFNARAVSDYVAPAATQFGAAEIIVSDGAGNIHAALRNIEEIVIHGGGGGDTLVVGGSFSATALLASTIHFNGEAGDDILDLRARTSNHRVVADGGTGGETIGDVAKLDFSVSQVTAIAALGLTGVAITHDGITDEFTNFESFQFEGGTTLNLAGVLAIDFVDPTVSSVTYPVGDGSLRAGELVVLTVNFSEAVIVAGGTPTLSLNSGGTASYTGGSGTSALTFTYVVGAGQNSADLAVTAFNPVGATVRDAGGNDAVLTGAVANPAGTLVIDTTAPTVSSVAITSATGALNNTLNVGDVVNVTVTMNGAVNVTGTPQLELTIGGSTVLANYSSGTGTSALVFSYTILAGQTDANGISIAANKLTLNSGTITDAAGNGAVLTHAAVADNTSYLVDTTAPTVSSVAITSATGALNSTLNVGDVVNVTVTMNGAVNVTGTPQLELTIGSSTVLANYASGTGTSALVFSYTILATQTDTNGISIAANKLTLNSGTISDAAGNGAVLTHAAVADNTSYLVDTTAPTVSSVAITSATGALNSTLNVGDVVNVTVTMNGAVNVTGTPQLELTIGGSTVLANYSLGDRYFGPGVQLHDPCWPDRCQRHQHRGEQAHAQQRHDHRRRRQRSSADACGGRRQYQLPGRHDGSDGEQCGDHRRHRRRE